MTIISTTVGKSLRRNGVAIMVNKRVQNAILGCNLKNDRMISVCLFPKQKQYPIVDVTICGCGDRRKVRRCKEQYCRGTWNVRSMNQGKLEVVKQDMARMNVNILGISKLTWTGMHEFNSDDHFIYYCGQESLRRNGIDIMVNKTV